MGVPGRRQEWEWQRPLLGVTKTEPLLGRGTRKAGDPEAGRAFGADQPLSALFRRPSWREDPEGKEGDSLFIIATPGGC